MGWYLTDKGRKNIREFSLYKVYLYPENYSLEERLLNKIARSPGGSFISSYSGLENEIVDITLLDLEERGLIENK